MTTTTDIDVEAALADLDERGWVRIPAVFDRELIDRILDEFERARSTFEAIQHRKGIGEQVRHASHHTHVLCRSMLGLLEPNVVSVLLERWFEGPYILNTMGLSVVPTDGAGVYTQKIHRDVRSFTGASRLWLNTLVMLDDSTTDNGATWMLEGSQHTADRPEPSDFYERAIRAEGRAGDVLLFDGNIWHAAGRNHSDADRHIVTPIYSRPFIKQQLDYPRAFGEDFGRIISPHLRQVLGYNARVPATLDEFYQHDDERYYRRDQG